MMAALLLQGQIKKQKRGKQKGGHGSSVPREQFLTFIWGILSPKQFIISASLSARCFVRILCSLTHPESLFYKNPAESWTAVQLMLGQNLSSNQSRPALFMVKGLQAINIWQLPLQSIAPEPNQPSSCPDAPDGSKQRTRRGQKVKSDLN